jgi:hypothetical protein
MAQHAEIVALEVKMDGDANHIESTEEFFTDRAAVLESITKLTTEGGVNDNKNN